MKDGMDYAEMLGMDVSSCDVVLKPVKRHRKKDCKEEVIAKVNEEEQEENQDDIKEEEDLSSYEDVTEKKQRKKFKFDIVYAEGVAVFCLIVSILLTNIFWENSGINTVFKRVFDTNTETLDMRTYKSFSAKSPSSDLTVDVDGGVMTFSGKGTMYPVCDGVVTSVIEEDGKYTLTVKHSDVFKTVIKGVDFVYAEKGDEVFKYIPIAYVNGNSATVAMYSSDSLLTNYIIEGGSIVWES